MWVPPTVAQLKGIGANICIIHQGNRLNPYIDYPFHPSVTPHLKTFVTELNASMIKTKVYYTVGQLSNHAVELWALAGLNGEVLLENSRNAQPTPAGNGNVNANNNDNLNGSGHREMERHAEGQQQRQRHGRHLLRGMGGNLIGNEWLEEHMVRGYEGGWFTLNPGDEEDASISDNTTSRWLNYYIRGQQWLFKEVGLRGLYYDGFGAER